MTGKVTIVIPTFKRPTQLVCAVESLFAQRQLDAIAPKLVIVDNDPDGSALAPAARLRALAPASIAIEVVHCRDAGVANARNAAMDKVETRFVAFLDDDQTASPEWLSNLLTAQKAVGAAVTFGPVQAVLPDEVEQHRDYFERFFSRRPAFETGLIDTYFGCGNALIDLHQISLRRPLFDPRMNEVGGEDDLLFIRVEAEGGRFAWAKKARVFEHVPRSRSQLSYTLARAVGFGQGPTRRAQEHGNLAGVAYWVGVGLGQSVVFGTLAGFGWLLGAKHRVMWLDRAAQGFGKMVWRAPFKFYGQSQIKTDVRSDEAGRVAPKPQA
ncbi:MAG: glycosyltransferase [Pseudomonadota bacterium]